MGTLDAKDDTEVLWWGREECIEDADQFSDAPAEVKKHSKNAEVEQASGRRQSSGNNNSESQEDTAGNEDRGNQENEDNLGGPKFLPPLFIQRYIRVTQILAESGVKNVVDFGCSECRLQGYVRSIEGMEEVTGVDLDPEVLQKHKYDIGPDCTDYMDKRSCPLVTRLFLGDVSRFDCRLAHCDAVVMVELIEHLHADTLEAFPSVVFGKIRPRVVVVTTPNAEYNVLFPGFTGFRHPDHKFEWTRAQFQDWCEGVAGQFGYTVQYEGVGKAPTGQEHLGFCTQIAQFHRTAEEAAVCEETDTPYTLISEEEFPVKPPIEDVPEAIVQESEYYMSKLCHKMEQQAAEQEDGYQEPEEDYYVDMELKKLMLYQSVAELCEGDVTKLRDALSDHGYDFSQDGDSVRFLREIYHSDESDHDDDEDDNDDDYLDKEVEPVTEQCYHGDYVDDWDDDEDDVPCNKINTDAWWRSGELFDLVPGQFSDAEV